MHDLTQEELAKKARRDPADSGLAGDREIRPFDRFGF